MMREQIGCVRIRHKGYSEEYIGLHSCGSDTTHNLKVGASVS